MIDFLYVDHHSHKDKHKYSQPRQDTANAYDTSSNKKQLLQVQRYGLPKKEISENEICADCRDRILVCLILLA